MNERTIQIDVIGKIEGTQFMKCKLYTNENIVIIMMNEFDYERLALIVGSGNGIHAAGRYHTLYVIVRKSQIVQEGQQHTGGIAVSFSR